MLESGDRMPLIKLKNEAGKLVELEKYLGKYFLVIYFYPKDNTPGCTIEAKSFRDFSDEFSSLNTMIIGISGDSCESHAKFKTRVNLNFELLSDSDGIAEKSFGIPRNLFGLLGGRVTFIVDLKGIIRLAYNSALNPASHAKKALNQIKLLQSDDQ